MVYITEPKARIKDDTHVSLSSPGGRTESEVVVYDCRLVIWADKTVKNESKYYSQATNSRSQHFGIFPI